MIQVHITRLKILRKGEVHYFRINLPADVRSITGAETVVNFSNNISGSESDYQQGAWLKIFRNRLVGRLSIQATGLPNIFLSMPVTERERNVGLADPSVEYYSLLKTPPAHSDGRDYLNPVRFWQPEPWTHGVGGNAVAVHIECNGLTLSGCYRDEFGKNRDYDTEYMVQIYLWYTI